MAQAVLCVGAVIQQLHLQFLGSYPKLEQLPSDSGFEFAVIGRSNVGKSALINALSNSKIARTSSQPGRTQHIVLFEYMLEKRLVDLPGYGYAKGGASLKKVLQVLIQDYLQYRKSLKQLWILCDIRRSLSPEDLHFIQWCELVSLPWVLVLTKADKLSRSKQLQTYSAISRQLEHYRYLQEVFMVSNIKKLGIATLLQHIEKL